MQHRQASLYFRLFPMLGATLIALGTAQPAAAQFLKDFEPTVYNANREGVRADGQDGWATPTTDASNPTDEWYLYTYLNNALGLPANPAGSKQFLGGSNRGDGFPRVQRSFGWNSNRAYRLTYDLAAHWTGDPNSVIDNLGSFSLQPADPAATRTFTALKVWNTTQMADGWDAILVGYAPADSVGDLEVQTSGGPGFTHLAADHWYRETILFDFKTNRLLETTITDLSNGQTTVYDPADLYLSGGQKPGQGMPGQLRLLVGGASGGNAMGIDNLKIDEVDLSKTATVQGTLALNGIDDTDPSLLSLPLEKIDFEFRNSSTNAPLFTLRAGLSPVAGTSTATFTLFNVPKGKYNIHIKGPKYLAQNVIGVDASGGSAIGVNANLIPGDVNNVDSPNMVDLNDLVVFFDTYGAVGGDPNALPPIPADANYSALADLNNDGQIDLSDLVIFFDAYGLEGDP